MATSDAPLQALARLFDRQRIADLDDLFAALRTHSRMTVFRRLSEMGYLTSCSHGGGFYTLRSVPRFDEAGLWRHGGVCFSIHGTLKEAVARLVQDAEDGRLHRELQERLQLRVHNTLLGLVRCGRLGREPFAGEYLYVSADRERAAAQIRQRALHATPGAPAMPVARGAPAPSLVIAVLLEVIHGAEPALDAAAVAARLRSQGVATSAEQVRDIFASHGLEKKTAPSASRPSRRCARPRRR